MLFIFKGIAGFASLAGFPGGGLYKAPQLLRSRCLVASSRLQKQTFDTVRNDKPQQNSVGAL